MGWNPFQDASNLVEDVKKEGSRALNNFNSESSVATNNANRYLADTTGIQGFSTSNTVTGFGDPLNSDPAPKAPTQTDEQVQNAARLENERSKKGRASTILFGGPKSLGLGTPKLNLARQSLIGY